MYHTELEGVAEGDNGWEGTAENVKKVLKINSCVVG
jgi:hypothetical protein